MTHQTPRPHVDRCDRCAETITDVDAGFCASLHQYQHSCGGWWQARYRPSLRDTETDEEYGAIARGDDSA